MLFGFFVMGLLAYYTYTDEPPIPAKVVDANGKVLFTGKDIIAGQEIFLKNGLMEYGSIFGHGAWLGPDYTADYLHRAAEMTIDYYGGSASDAARQQTITDFKTNRYDAATGVLTYQRGASRRLPKTDRLLRRIISERPRRNSVCVPMRSPTRNKSGSSPPFSVGRPGRGQPCARTKIIPTRTTGRPNRSSAITPRRTPCFGACSP